MAFKDLAEYFDDRLHLPIGGVTYDIPSPDHELGLWVTELVSTATSVQQGLTPDPDRTLPKLRFEGEEYDDESDEAKLYQRLLGPAYGQMREDGVSWPKIKFVVEVVMVWIAAGEAAAEAHWNRGGDPKAIAEALQPAPASRAERRRATGSTPTGTASTTGTRGSTRATTSRSTSGKTSAVRHSPGN